MTAPVIYRQPESLTVNTGDTATFSCQAVGDAPLTFQWYETTAGLLAGETNTILSLTAAAGMTGNGYYCIVTSQGTDSTTSDTATLSVGDTVLTITHQPKAAAVTEGDIASFTVRAVGEGTLSYQWKNSTGNIAGATSATYAFTTQLSDSGETFEVDVTDSNGTLTSNTVGLTVYEDIGAEPEPDRGPRTALVWSFDNGTFTWMDASHAEGGGLTPVVCMNYGFNPGWQVRWQSWIDDGTLWSDLLTANTRWNDLYSAADEKSLFWLSTKNLLKSDQLIEKRNGKEYFVERKNIDFKDLAGWTSESWKFLRQFVFHAESDIDTDTFTPNVFTLTVGWGANLMDKPQWEPPVTVKVNSADRSGQYKADLRTNGRYLSIRMDFIDTNEFTMTGGDMDMELSHGR